MEFVAPPPRSMREAFTGQFRVIHALMLRDIKTRFGASYFGFTIGLLIPLVHIAVLLVIFKLIGRRAAIGTDVTAFISTALIPFICWSYTHQKVSRCLVDNKPLLSFPIVKMVDIVIARSLTELMNSTLIVFVAYFALTLLGTEIFLFDPPKILLTFVLSYLLGVSTGMIFSLMILAAPGTAIVAFLIIPMYWASSGNFFIPSGLPEQLVTAMSVFPLSHLVDFGRTGFYPEYTTSYYNLWYPISVILTNVTLFFFVQRAARSTLTKR